MWHEGIIFKLKPNDIFGELLNLLCDFLRNRKHRVVLNVQVSTWTSVNVGVPQGSILGPLCFFNIHKLFSIYKNELSPNTRLFTDDTSLFFVVHNRDSSAAKLNNDLALSGRNNGK